MIDHYNSNNNLLSWSSSFHFLCLIWLGIRGAFWLRTVTSSGSWGVFSFYTLYWLPNPIQFGSFMLLPLFFTQILYPEEWKKYWVMVRPVYYIFLLLLVLFQIVWALLAALDKDTQAEDGNCLDENGLISKGCFHTEYSSDVFRFVTAVCFTLLALCQGMYALKISNLEKSYYDCHFLLSPKMMFVMNVILVLCFLTKGAYQFGAIFETYFLPDIPLQGSSDVDVAILLTFELWEYIPTLLLVLSVTSKSMGITRRPTSRNTRNTKELMWRTSSTGSEQAVLELKERNYGSVAFAHENDDVVSICSDANSFAGSSFERSNHGQYMPKASIQPSSLTLQGGRFEVPSSLSPKSSWLPVPSSGSSSASYDDGKHSLSARSFSITPDSTAMSANSSFLQQVHAASSHDKMFRRSDQYAISLRQNMRRGASEDGIGMQGVAASPYSQFSVSLRQPKIIDK